MSAESQLRVQSMLVRAALTAALIVVPGLFFFGPFIVFAAPIYAFGLLAFAGKLNSYVDRPVAYVLTRSWICLAVVSGCLLVFFETELQSVQDVMKVVKDGAWLTVNIAGAFLLPRLLRPAELRKETSL